MNYRHNLNLIGIAMKDCHPKILIRIMFWAILLISPDVFADQKEITILHTNDLHSHVLGFSPNIDYRADMIGGDATKGGWAKLAPWR